MLTHDAPLTLEITGPTRRSPKIASLVAAACLVGGAGILVPASAEVSIGVSIQAFPDFAPVPGYPVYYAPQLDANLFFYDGLYWVFADDQWYASDWYNGPWDVVSPDLVPLYVLRVPVRYYRLPPPDFRDSRPDAPPRWGQHWGGDWEQRHHGWDNWDRSSAPPPAPLPSYQREFARDRYPSRDEQEALRARNYHYQPHEAVVQQHFQRLGPAPSESGAAQRSARDTRHEDRPAPIRQAEAKPRPEPEHAPPPPAAQPRAAQPRDAQPREAPPHEASREAAPRADRPTGSAQKEPPARESAPRSRDKSADKPRENAPADKRDTERDH